MADTGIGLLIAFLLLALAAALVPIIRHRPETGERGAEDSGEDRDRQPLPVHGRHVLPAPTVPANGRSAVRIRSPAPRWMAIIERLRLKPWNGWWPCQPGHRALLDFPGSC